MEGAHSAGPVSQPAAAGRGLSQSSPGRSPAPAQGSREGGGQSGTQPRPRNPA